MPEIPDVREYCAMGFSVPKALSWIIADKLELSFQLAARNRLGEKKSAAETYPQINCYILENR